jgi:GNAT superfamily N-acetyltransferase
MARVWLADSSDSATVAALMCEFRDWFGYEEPSDAAMREGVERLLADDDAEFLLAASDGRAAEGVCQLRYRYGVWLAAEDCWLEDLFVREAARGRGLGRALVAEAIERARARGCRRMELDVNEANRSALRLYDAFGFSAKAAQFGARNLLMRRRI